MKLNLRTKTILIILLTSLAALLVAGVIINWRVNVSFENFLEDQFQFLGTRQGMMKQMFPDLPNAPDGTPFGARILRDVRQDQLFTNLESDFREQVWQGIFWAGLISSGVAIAVGWFFANRITKPLEKLKRHIGRLRKHDYDGAVTDITDDEIGELGQAFDELRVELRRVEELRKDAISDMAHEIMTPLQTLIGVTEGIEQGIYKGKEKVDVMQEAVERIRMLVDDMRHFSHSRAKSLRIEWEEIGLKEFVNKELESLFAQAKDKHLQIEVDIPADLQLKADRKMLGQILTNLVKNAINFTDKGSVKISAESKKNVETKHASSLRIVIQDTGMGISAKDMPYIFERFYRGDKSRSRETGGTGLGLAIVKEYIDQLGWEIEVESEETNGSTFILLAK